MRNALRLVGMVVVLGVGACSPAAAPDPTLPAIPTAGPSATPLPTPVPPWAEIEQMALVPSRESAGWQVIGILGNRSDQDRDSVLLHVWLEDATGNRVAEQEVSPAFPRVAAGERVPFTATFAQLGDAQSARAEVSSFQEAVIERGTLDLEGLEITQTETGTWNAIGRLRNPGVQPVSIQGLTLLSADESGQPMELARWTAGLSYLRPGEETPFLASFHLDPGTTPPTLYADVTVAAQVSAAIPIALDPAPRMVLDWQSFPYLVGQLVNQDTQARLASLLLAVYQGDELLTLSQISTAIPLAPGESRPFATTDLPGLSMRLADREWQLDELSVLARLDPLASSLSEQARSPLTIQATQQDFLGGTLFLRGLVLNGTSAVVQSPTVHAVVYNEAGGLLTAGWQTVAEALGPGESAGFLIAMRMPYRTHPSSGEYDLWAAGLAP